MPTQHRIEPSKPRLPQKWRVTALRSMALGATAFELSGACLAQEGGSGTAERARLPEVVVTAERQETLLRRTPVSVGTVGKDEIEKKATSGLSDLVGVIAGVTVPNGFTNMPQAMGIRGVGNSQPAMTQAVGVYVDDVPLIRGYAAGLWDLPDVERIEVLRGPQGTLYGQNSSGGAAKIVSRDPSKRGEAWLSGALGNYDARELHGYATGQIGQDLAASLAFSTRHNDGFGYNATLDKRVNKLHATQARVKLKYSTADDFSVVLSVDGLRDRSDLNTINFPLNHPNSAPRVTYTSLDTGDVDARAGGVSLKMTKRLSPDVTFKSITAYRSYIIDPMNGDWGGLAQERFWTGQDIKQRAVSQEFQFQGLHRAWSWTAGTLFTADRFHFHRLARTLPLTAATPNRTEALTKQTTKDVGAYGQARYAWTRALGLTVGLRAYHTEQDADNRFWRTDAEWTRTLQVYAAPDLKASASGVLPKLGVDFQLDPGTFLYGTLARGEKFGGFNRAAESLAAAGVATAPEKVTSYEAGAKVRLFDGTADASLALFYNDFKDYHAGLTATLVNGVRVNDTVLVNAGNAKTYGADIDLVARLTPSLNWKVSLELLRTKFTTFLNPSGAAGTNYVGNQIPWAPRVSLGTTLSWAHPVGDGQLTADLSLRLIGRQFSDVANNPAVRTPQQSYIDISTRYTPSDSPWTYSFRVRNLQDRAYAMLPVLAPPLGLHNTFYNSPRTFFFSGRYDF